MQVAVHAKKEIYAHGKWCVRCVASHTEAHSNVCTHTHIHGRSRAGALTHAARTQAQWKPERAPRETANNRISRYRWLRTFRRAKHHVQHASPSSFCGLGCVSVQRLVFHLVRCVALCLVWLVASAKQTLRVCRFY